MRAKFRAFLYTRKYEALQRSVLRLQNPISSCRAYKIAKEILNLEVQAYLRAKIEETRKYYPGWEYIEVGMESDHIHIHVIISPKYAVSNVVATIKKIRADL